jgi:hypothetical protein
METNTDNEIKNNFLYDISKIKFPKEEYTFPKFQSTKNIIKGKTGEISSKIYPKGKPT